MGPVSSPPWVFLLVLFLLCVPGVQAQTTCAGLNQNSCYAARDSCTFDPFTGSCTQGAPFTCESYHTDATGCNSAPASCAINPLNNHCYTLPPACNSLSVTNCTLRSDCQLADNSCISGAAPGTCGSFTTWPSCVGGGCFWDLFVGTGTCFNSLQEVSKTYPCGHWSGYPYDYEAPACRSHGCAPTGSFCYSIDTYLGNVAVEATSSFTFNVESASIIPNTLTYIARVLIPMSQISNFATPQLTSLSFGPGTGIEPDYCNSISYQPPLGSPIGPSSYVDQMGLSTFILNTITNTKTLNFNASTPLGSAALHVVGGWNVNTTLGGSIVKEVSLSADLQTLIVDLQINLERCVARCGCTKVTLPTYTYYTVTMSTTLRMDGDNIARSTQQSAISINTFGTVQIDGNSNTLFRVLLPSVTDARNNCPVGQQQRTLQIREIYTCPDSNTTIGLRNSSDLYIRPGNCFGDEVISVEPPVQSGGYCNNLIMTRGRCTPITADGNALNLCSYQLPANRIADLGSDVPYSPIFNFNHDYYHFPRSWRTAVGINDTEYLSVGIDTEKGDLISITSNQPTFPDVSFEANILYVKAGFLRTPNALLDTNITLFDSTPNATITEAAPFAYFNPDVTLAVWLPNQDERQTFGLRISLPSLRIIPINTRGEVTSLNPPITWNMLAPVSLTAPREQCSNFPLAICTIGGSRVGLIGIDTFSVPMFWLQRLAPATGYRVVFDYNITLPNGDTPVEGATIPIAGRRLLQVNENGEQTEEGTVSIDIQGVAIPVQEADIDIGHTEDSVSTSFGVTAGVLTGAVAGSVSFAFVLGKLGWISWLVL